MSYVSNVNEKENIFIFWEKEVEAYHRWIKLLKQKKKKSLEKIIKLFTNSNQNHHISVGI